MTKSIFAQRLTLARQRQGLTQAQLAERLGIPLDTVARWERGMPSIGDTRVLDVAQALGVPLADIVCHTGVIS